MNREAQEPLGIDDLNRIEKRAFGTKYCMHPEASRQNCRGSIVRAHTIQRNGGLSRIAEKGHVYSCLAHVKIQGGEPHFYTPSRVGVRQASTFTGFCNRHDSRTFAPLERDNFKCSPEQVFLLQYRALCRELFLKRADIKLTTLRHSLDRGRDETHQRFVQEYANLYTSGLRAGLAHLEDLKKANDRILLHGDYSTLRYYAIGIDTQPQILCSTVHQPEFDFAGKHLQDIANLSCALDWLHFSLIPSDRGGFVVFSWLDQADASESFIRSLDSLSDTQIPHAVVRFVFEYFEMLATLRN